MNKTVSFSQGWMGWCGGSRVQELGGTGKSFNGRVNPDSQTLGLSLEEGVGIN